jgi:hypothetical protein
VEHTTYITYNQWWLMELSYGKAAVMITIWLTRRASYKNSFLKTAEPLKFSIYSSVTFCHMFILCLMMTEITRSRAAQLKFLISVFSARVYCKKLITCKYFALFLYMFGLKFQLLKFKLS